MSVDGLDPAVRAGNKELGVDELFDSEDDAVLDLEADCSPGIQLQRRLDGQKENTYPEFSTALLAYSTWKMRPSGEYVLAERS